MERAEILKAYQEELNRIGKSEKTVNGYLFNVGKFLDWMEVTSGETFDGNITQTDVKVYKSHMETVQKAALSTINTKLSAIQNFCDFLYNTYGMSPVKVQKKKGSITPKVETLDKKELYQYLRYVENNANLLHRTIVETFLNTGIRESELCNLELDDIVATPKNAYIIIRSGKGDKYREIPIVGDYKKLLIEYMEHRPMSDSNKLFIGNRGTLTPNGVYKLVHRLGEQKGLHVYPHMLRHQYLSGLAKNCKTAQDFKDLAEIAGHSTVETTMKHYVSGSSEKKRRIANELNYFE